MNRPFPRYRFLLAALALAVVVAPSAGCMGLLTTVAYLVKGTDIPAEYNFLKGKRVVVVCQPMVELQYRSSSAAKDLGREISKLLQERVPKIQVVDQRKVDEWIDSNTWDEYAEIGKALDADIVVGVDLEGFNILLDPTLYQGKATVRLKVVDCAAGGKTLVDKPLPQIVFPPNAPIPTSERPNDAQFRREFIAILADQIARYFYAHDPFADHAIDATTLN